MILDSDPEPLKSEINREAGKLVTASLTLSAIQNPDLIAVLNISDNTISRSARFSCMAIF